MTTIKDVAREAGVSISTASYALNGKGNISEATRAKVLEAARKLKLSEKTASPRTSNGPAPGRSP